MKKQKREKFSNLNNIEINDINSDAKKKSKNNQIVNINYNKNIKIESFDNQLVKNNSKYSDKNSKDIIYKRTDKSKLDSINDNEKDWVINKINLTDILISICFCFKKNRKNAYKLLLKEAINVIIEKLDIFNLFRDLCSIENSKNNFKHKPEIIKMSKE